MLGRPMQGTMLNVRPFSSGMTVPRLHRSSIFLVTLRLHLLDVSDVKLN